VCGCVGVCVCVCVCVGLYVCACVYLCMCVCVCMCVMMRVCTHTCAILNTFFFLYICKQIHKQTHIRVCAYMVHSKVTYWAEKIIADAAYMQHSWVPTKSTSDWKRTLRMTQVSMSHATNVNTTRHIYKRVMSQISESTRHVTYMNEACRTCIWMSRVTNMNASHHTHEWVMSHMLTWHVAVIHVNE